MNDKNPTPQNLEDLFRQQLGGMEADPGKDAWKGIAARQKTANFRLRLKTYSLYATAAAAAVLLVIGGWRHFAAVPTDVNAVVHQSVGTLLPQSSSLPGTEAAPVASATQATETTGGPHPFAAFTKLLQPFRDRPNTVKPKELRFRIEDGLHYENPVSGTKVNIAPNSLLRPNGTPATGEAEFHIWEYRTLEDYMASGIPMHYSDDRGDYSFNTGGMFEVRVNQGQEALRLLPGRTCDVQFVPTHNLNQASLYKFDERDGKWKYEPSAAFQQADAVLPPVVSEARAIADNTRGSGGYACLPPFTPLPKNTEAAAFVKQGVQVGYDLLTDKKPLPGWFLKNPELKDEAILNTLEHSLIQVVHHKDQKHLFFPQDLNNFFTELKAFKNGYFEVADQQGSKNTLIGKIDQSHHTTSQRLDGYWDRVSIVQGASVESQKGSVCVISLYRNNELLQFYANLVPSPETETFDVDQAFAEYRQLRETRLTEFRNQVNGLRNFLAVSPVFATPEEWCMEKKEWMAYFNNNKGPMRKRYAKLVHDGYADQDELAASTWNGWRSKITNMEYDATNKQNTIVYGLKLAGFGLHNCDQIFMLGIEGRVESIQPHFFTSAGDPILPKSIAMLERTTRLFFTLPNLTSMPAVGGRNIDCIITDKAGRTYYLRGVDYSKAHFKGKQEYTFQVEDVSDKTRTPGEWLNVLNI
jgi:hypothetical protein